MTAIQGSSRRSLLGVVAAGLTARARAKGRPSRLAAAIQDHTLTLAAMALVDVGGFTVWHHGGWFVLAGSLLILDLKLNG